jgi:hypothetical protein
VPLVPDEVRRLLGQDRVEVTGLGSSRVLRGNGYVVKVGRPERIARESFVLGDLAPRLPLRTPRLIDAGQRWLAITDLGDSVLPQSWSPAPLRDLAALHAQFTDSAVLYDTRLADPFGADLNEHLAVARAAVASSTVIGSGLSPALADLLADPTPLLDALADQPMTLIHGDAWYGNLVWRSAVPFWIDWEECSRGPAVADLATWLYGTPFVPPTPTPDLDLTAYGPVGRKAMDAAFLLLFLVLDLPVLSEIPNASQVLADRSERARLWLSSPDPRSVQVPGPQPKTKIV